MARNKLEIDTIVDLRVDAQIKWKKAARQQEKKDKE